MPTAEFRLKEKTYLYCSDPLNILYVMGFLFMTRFNSDLSPECRFLLRLKGYTNSSR